MQFPIKKELFFENTICKIIKKSLFLGKNKDLNYLFQMFPYGGNIFVWTFFDYYNVIYGGLVSE